MIVDAEAMRFVFRSRQRILGPSGEMTLLFCEASNLSNAHNICAAQHAATFLVGI